MGPENRMLNRLKPKLERDLGWYIEKTNNAYRGGRPDWDIFGNNGFCGFIEAKHWDKKVQRGEWLDSAALLSKCSALQQAWLNDRAETDHHVAVLCGFPARDCYAFLPLAWNSYPGGVEVVSYSKLLGLLDFWMKHEPEKAI